MLYIGSSRGVTLLSRVLEVLSSNLYKDTEYLDRILPVVYLSRSKQIPE
jgi:hypothetical protein